jgi:hypothetical protein
LILSSCQGSGENKVTQAAGDSSAVAKDPLPSWNDPLKGEIIAYVNKVCKDGSPDFVPLADRIATFDNDGTLWIE